MVTEFKANKDRITVFPGVNLYYNFVPQLQELIKENYLSLIDPKILDSSKELSHYELFITTTRLHG